MDYELKNAATLAVESRFYAWATSRGSVISPKVGLKDFGRMGRGAIALADIETDEILFSLPRSLLLTTTTSSLPSLLPAEAWSTLTGWSPLILILMYESLRADVDPNWKPYFDIMPPANSFDSLMFWSKEELSELEGCMVLGKIGKEEAEKDFRNSVLPFVEAHEGVFGSGLRERYTVELFHHMGSLVLSRSFHVEAGEQGEESDEDEEEEERESIGDVAMVPMADLLNAQSGSDNARLFYEPMSLNMISTKLIKKGEQIYNTYADPPNSDLLRRYGHVDEENDADLVEMGLEMVIELVGDGMGLERDASEVRAEWLLDSGIEDTFSFTASHELPSELISTLRTFLASPTEFAKIQEKESPPRPKIDAAVADWAKKLLTKRLTEYPTSIEADEALLLNAESTVLPPRRRMAVIVRLSEKKILQGTLLALEEAWPVGGPIAPPVDAKKEKKRAREEQESRRKKSKMSL